MKYRAAALLSLTCLSLVSAPVMRAQNKPAADSQNVTAKALHALFYAEW